MLSSQKILHKIHRSYAWNDTINIPTIPVVFGRLELTTVTFLKGVTRVIQYLKMTAPKGFWAYVV